MQKILTVCLMGISRSVGMVDVLKLHYEPVCAIPMGYKGNSEETKEMLYEWADDIIIMQAYMKDRVPEKYHHKMHVCEVGPDTYGGGGSARAPLISQCFKWLDDNHKKLNLVRYYNGTPNLSRAPYYKKV